MVQMTAMPCSALPLEQYDISKVKVCKGLSCGTSTDVWAMQCKLPVPWMQCGGNPQGPNRQRSHWLTPCDFVAHCIEANYRDSCGSDDCHALPCSALPLEQYDISKVKVCKGLSCGTSTDVWAMQCKLSVVWCSARLLTACSLSHNLHALQSCEHPWIFTEPFIAQYVSTALRLKLGNPAATQCAADYALTTDSLQSKRKHVHPCC